MIFCLVEHKLLLANFSVKCSLSTVAAVVCINIGSFSLFASGGKTSLTLFPKFS